jgi:hypothetical protein
VSARLFLLKTAITGLNGKDDVGCVQHLTVIDGRYVTHSGRSGFLICG